MELVLPSGTRLGHRSLQRYYKQRLRTTEPRESILINRLASQYRALGWYPETREVKALDRANERRQQTRENQLKLRIGMAQNNQQHFRQQVDF